ncbi:MAG: OmpA family protein [Myxococcales bacterium]|nr:OmpA family protein [Myxococcales bacterium]
MPSQTVTRRAFRNTVVSVGLVGCLGIAGCASNTGKGAVAGGGAGALLGAGIGALAGGKSGALIGAGVGAAAGAGTGALIGRYMDKQEQALKEVKGAKVDREGDKLLVKFDSAILFDTNKAKLKPQSERDLAEFAKVLKEYKDTDLIIEGHTDNKGKKARNQKLSTERAEAVIGYLEAQGVERSRMRAIGFADEKPIGDNGTEDGRMQNRRVQVEIAANEELKKQEQTAAAPTSP